MVPVYNESTRISKTVKILSSYLKKHFVSYEMIFINDSSKDNSLKLLSVYKSKNISIISNISNMGKGFSVKRGMLKAKYPLILFSDFDLATPISELPKLISQIEKGFDVAIASRSLKNSNVKLEQPFYRVVLGKTFSVLVSLIAISGFKDTQCGFKLFTKKAAKTIFKLQTFERFSFDVEILFIAKKYNLKIKEVPVTWIDGGDSKVSPIKDSFLMFKDLIKIRLNDLRGLYRI